MKLNECVLNPNSSCANNLKFVYTINNSTGYCIHIHIVRNNPPKKMMSTKKWKNNSQKLRYWFTGIILKILRISKLLSINVKHVFFRINASYFLIHLIITNTRAPTCKHRKKNFSQFFFKFVSLLYSLQSSK